jgi:hypothetical protein
MSVHEVIDLTTETLEQPASNTLDPIARDDRKLKRKKKSSNSKSGTPEEVLSTLNDSNVRNAKSDHSSKRKRIHEIPKSNGRRERRRQADKHDSGEPDSAADLFFVDLPPIAIPPIPVSRESISTTNGESEKVGKLLLPSHVTVFGDALVEIISQSLSDSDDDEFIKYLDYEDTRVCIHYSFVFLRLHSIVFLRMYHDITMTHLMKEPPLKGLFARTVELKENIRLLLVL